MRDSHPFKADCTAFCVSIIYISRYIIKRISLTGGGGNRYELGNDVFVKSLISNLCSLTLAMTTKSPSYKSYDHYKVLGAWLTDVTTNKQDIVIALSL